MSVFIRNTYIPQMSSSQWRREIRWPGAPDGGSASRTGASAFGMRERGPQKPSRQMGCMGAEDPAKLGTSHLRRARILPEEGLEQVASLEDGEAQVADQPEPGRPHRQTRVGRDRPVVGRPVVA